MLTRKLLTCLMSATVLVGSGFFLSAQDSADPFGQVAQVEDNLVRKGWRLSNARDSNRSTAWHLTTNGEQNKFKKETALAVQAFKAAESDEAKSAAKADLRNALAADYENKMDQYDEHLEKLEKELESMRERLARRRAAQKDMVDLKLKETIANADGLGWPSGPQSSRFSGSGLFQPSYTTQVVPRMQSKFPSNVRETVRGLNPARPVVAPAQPPTLPTSK